MTNQHPITPPPELVQQLLARFHTGDTLEATWAIAFRAGADQELEAVEEEIIAQGWFANSTHRRAQLRASRRPKPTTLKEQALELVSRIEKAKSPWELSELETIRRALKATNA